MMRTSTHIYLLLALLSIPTLVCCRKEGNGFLSDEAIVFSPKGKPSTKALMDEDGINSDGNKLQVRDWLTDFTGTASWMGADNYYINEEIEYSSAASSWGYNSGVNYPWTVNGSHHFFAWLTYDAGLNETSDTFFGSPLTFVDTDAAPKRLTIPTHQMTIGGDLFDFMYSDVELVDAADHISGSPVTLEMNHLFTAFRIDILNNSGNRIRLKSVTLTGLYNNRGATVAFTANSPVVTYTDGSPASSDIALYSADPGTVFPSNDTRSNLTGWILMWPQTYTDLSESGASLHIEYNVIDTADQESDDLSSDLVLSDQTIFRRDYDGMDPGIRYSFLLQFKKSTIDLSFACLPWEYDTYDWDYSSTTASANSDQNRGGVLVFYRGTGDEAVAPTSEEWSAKTMRFNTTNEVLTGRFYVESPYTGQWYISPYPASAAQYFTFDPDPLTGDIDVHTDNGKVEFTVRPNADLSPTSTQTLYFNLYMYYNGDWHDVNSEFNRKNIKLVLDAN